MWHIWRVGNNCVFKGKNLNTDQSIHFINHYVTEIMLNNLKLAGLKVGRRTELIGWEFPKEDWVKCNSDGACMEGGNRTGCGGVLRDSAEVWGIITGLELAWARGFKKVWMESDSLTAVNLIKKGCSKLRHYHGLVDYIGELCRRNWDVFVSHHHREGNRVADALANCSTTGGIGMTVFDHPPTYCLQPLRDDMCGVALPRSIASVFS